MIGEWMEGHPMGIVCGKLLLDSLWVGLLWAAA